MKIIKISTDLEMTAFEFPSGSYGEQNEFLRELIGNKCAVLEHVRPRRLYTDLEMRDCATQIPGQCVSMLVDEEGLLKDNVPNLIGSYLYETDKHGHPIMGNILFVGEKWGDDGIDFCGIADFVFDMLEPRLKIMILATKEFAVKEALGK